MVLYFVRPLRVKAVPVAFVPAAQKDFLNAATRRIGRCGT
jgi:hypothetical protein